MLLLLTTQAALTTRRFQHWYWYDDSIANIMHENCSSEYTNYVDHYDNRWHLKFPILKTQINDGAWVYMHPLVSCLMKHLDELSKANMATASVFLGLTPTILALAGSTLAETTFLATRRPPLAFLLATGSPSVSPLRTFSHEDVPKMLERRGALGSHTLSSDNFALPKALTVIAEFTIAMAAIVNVLLVSYELGMKTILSFGTDVWFDPLMWCLLTGLAHLWGCMVFRHDVDILSPPPRRGKSIRERLSLWAQVSPLQV